MTLYYLLVVYIATFCSLPLSAAEAAQFRSPAVAPRSMKDVFAVIADWATAVYNHPSLVRERMSGRNFGQPGHKERIPIHRKFDWVPAFIHMSLTFRDVNRLYLRYDEPKTALEREINHHVSEDSQHYLHFLHDLRVLGFDLEQKLTDAIHTIWSDKGLEVRRYIYGVLTVAKQAGENPCLRVAAMQAMESTSKLFFDASSVHASNFHNHTGVELHYFGHKHVEGEESAALDLDLFTEANCPEPVMKEALDLARTHFGNFKVFLDFKDRVVRDPTRVWPEPKVLPPFRLRARARVDKRANV